jgi:hypothetical protein
MEKRVAVEVEFATLLISFHILPRQVAWKTFSRDGSQPAPKHPKCVLYSFYVTDLWRCWIEELREEDVCWKCQVPSCKLNRLLGIFSIPPLYSSREFWLSTYKLFWLFSHTSLCDECKLTLGINLFSVWSESMVVRNQMGLHWTLWSLETQTSHSLS